MHALDPTHLINTYGLWGILAIIFAESGLFFGFFLPGDSLLVTAGLLASTHRAHDVHLNLAALLVGCSIAAIAGDQVGYAFGSRFGPALFSRSESRLFKPDHLHKARRYLDTRGAKMLLMARFILELAPTTTFREPQLQRPSAALNALPVDMARRKPARL